MSNKEMKEKFIRSQTNIKSPKEKRSIDEHTTSFYHKKQYDFEKRRYGRSLSLKRIE